MFGSSPFSAIVEIPIIESGKIVGFKRYRENGIFGALQFIGYRWL